MNTQPNFDGVRWTARADLTSGVAQTILCASAEFLTIGITVPAGGSVWVETSASSTAHVAAGTAKFYRAEGLGAGGVVTSSMLDVIDGPITAVRATATGAGACIETLQGG